MKHILLFGILIGMTVIIAGCTGTTDSVNSEDEDLQMSVYVDGNEENTGEKIMANRIAVFDTTMGEFSIELFEDEMPITTGNFIKLAQEGYFDGTRFHRVIADFMIQGGDPQSAETSKRNRWGTGGPGYAIADEHVAGEKLSNVRGSISMANSGPQSGGSQFFINVVDNSFLDWDKQPSSSKHPVFGEVVSGMSIVDSISNIAVGSGDQPKEDVVVNATTSIYISLFLSIILERR